MSNRKRRVGSFTLSDAAFEMLAAVVAGSDLSRSEAVDGLLCRAAVRCGMVDADELDKRSQHAARRVLRWLQDNDQGATE